MNREKFAKFTALANFMKLLITQEEANYLSNHQRARAPCGGISNYFRISNSQRNRLFKKNMFAGSKKGDCKVLMSWGRSANRNIFNIGILKNHFKIGDVFSVLRCWNRAIFGARSADVFNRICESRICPSNCMRIAHVALTNNCD